jgi:hypothetical protein
VRGRSLRWRPAARLDAQKLLALALYAVASFLIFGLRVAASSHLSYVGTGVDPQIFIWSFAWWPHAVLHGVNPFITRAVWAPDEVNLAWTTSVPGLAVLFAPVTLLADPVAAFNVAAVLMPALAAWTCFLLCRHLTGSTWASLAGGYLFGFSSYMLGQQEGHLHMTSVFLIPLIALVLICFVQRAIDRGQLTVRLGLLLAAQLTFSTEVFFTVTIAIATATGIAYLSAPERRPELRALVAPMAGAYFVALVITAPLVYYAVSGFDAHPINLPRQFAADLANVVVPTKLTLLSVRERVSAGHFLGNDSERGAYLGLPILIAVGVFARRERSTATGRFLLLCLVTGVLSELGAFLRLDGRRLLPLPLATIDHLPLVDNVLPVRLSLFVSLAAAVIVAFVAAEARSSWTRQVLPALAVISILPNLGSHAWITRPDNPPFISQKVYRTCLLRDENTLVFPAGGRGDAMLWQAESAFWFRMAGGYLSPVVPANFRQYRAAHATHARRAPRARSSRWHTPKAFERSSWMHTTAVPGAHSFSDDPSTWPGSSCTPFPVHRQQRRAVSADRPCVLSKKIRSAYIEQQALHRMRQEPPQLESTLQRCAGSGLSPRRSWG